MPENNPPFKKPSGLEVSISENGTGVGVSVASYSASALEADRVAATEYKQRVDNPLAPNAPAFNQPGVVAKIIDKAKNTSGNSTPGMNGVRENPWMASGMTGSGDAVLFNPGSRGGMSLEQKRDRL